MSQSVNLPALGESVTEGTVTRWLKKVGDRVEVDEPLLEVSTDKVDTEIPSPIAGVVEEILVAEDETIEVGTALVTIGEGAGGGSAEPAPAAEGTPAEPAPAAEGTPAQPPAPATAEPAAPAAPAEAASAEATVAEPAQQEASTESAPQEASGDAPQQPSGDPEQQVGAEPTADPAPDPTPDAEAPGDTSPPATPSAPDPSADAEVPSADAPAPEEGTAPHPPAPAENVDPPPAAEAGTAPEPAPTAEETPAPEPPAEGAAEPQPVPAAEPAQSPEPVPAAELAQSPEPDPQPSPEPDPTPEPADQRTGNLGYVTPLVRKLANERGVDITALNGTGIGGRIRKQDVLAAADAAPVAGASAGGTSQPRQFEPLEVSPLRGTTVPMSRLRKVIAERAVVSMQSSAQLTSVVEVDVTLVAAFRDRVKEEFLATTGLKLSYLPFFALAAAEALRAYPIVNASIDGDTIVYPGHENLSIAVDTERGLLTPVIRDAGDLDIAGLAAQIADLASRTRENKLKPDELAGGTFTLTNTGSRGALFDTPIVFLPQSAILGTGIVTKKAVVVTDNELDAIAVRSTVYLALSYDHRIVDGADAARFLVAVKNRLESGDFEDVLGI